jgi:hypothetical protein
MWAVIYQTGMPVVLAMRRSIKPDVLTLSFTIDDNAQALAVHI